MYSLEIKTTELINIISGIGQCPAKFGKSPTKIGFDRTFVRSGMR